MNKIKQETLSEYNALLSNKGGAYDRLCLLFDEGTFVETGRFVKCAKASVLMLFVLKEMP